MESKEKAIELIITIIIINISVIGFILCKMVSIWKNSMLGNHKQIIKDMERLQVIENESIDK